MWVLAGLLSGSVAASAAGSQARIEGGINVGATTVRLALPFFPISGTNLPADAGPLVDTFNETLWDDLEFSGIIELIGQSFYPVSQVSNPADIVPADWTDPRVDTEVMAFGRAEVDRDGQFFVEAHLWDMRTAIESRELFGDAGLGFRIALNERGVRLLAHQIADRIVFQLGGGLRGIAQTRIAFVSDRTTPAGQSLQKELWIMDYDGHNQFQLTTARETSIAPRWSPDGRQITFTGMSSDGVNVFVISTADRRLFPFPAFAGTTSTASFSPDGTRLAFASSHQETRGIPDVELYVASTNGENVRRLTQSPGVDSSPVWNPATGREIAFVSDRAGTPQIYVVDAEGGNLRRIVTEGGHADEPAWSENGRFLAFVWQRSGRNNDIYLHDLQNGQNYQLTQNSGSNERPSFSPDGRHIVFESNRSGSKQIYSMLLDGSRVHQLTREGSNESPAWSNYMAQ
jgi:TolB protein